MSYDESRYGVLFVFILIWDFKDSYLYVLTISIWLENSQPLFLWIFCCLILSRLFFGNSGGKKKKKDLPLCPTHLFLLFSILFCLFVVQCNSIWICSINLSFSSLILSSAVPIYWVLNFRHRNFHWEFLFDSIYKKQYIKCMKLSILYLYG